MPSPDLPAGLPDWFDRDDPWLPRKMRQYQEVLAAEQELGPLVEQALARLLDEAREHVTSGAVTAAGSRWPGGARFWLNVLSMLLFGPITGLFVARFVQEMTQIRVEVRPEPARFAEAFFDLVADLLADWPEHVLAEAEQDIADGLAVKDVLDINAPSRKVAGEMARLRRTIDSPSTKESVRREARARLAALRRRDDREQRRWWPRVVAATRNLSMSALNAGTLAGAETYASLSGAAMVKQWWSMEDPNVRQAHRVAHGQVQSLDEPFTVGGLPMWFPGDPTAPPDLVVNCRCSLLTMTRSQADRHAMRTNHSGAHATGETQGGVTMPAAVEIHQHEVPEDQLPPLLAAGTTLPDELTAVRWRGVLAPLGVRSGDNRMLAAPEDGVELEHRDFPLPLLYMEKTGPGHDGSVVVGRIDRAWVEDSKLMGEGVFDLEDDAAREVVRKIDGGFHRWVSVRVDKATSEYVLYRGEQLVDANEFLLEDADVQVIPEDVEQVEIARRWRLMNAALVAEPAFQEAVIELIADEEDEAEPAADEDTVAASTEDGPEFGGKKPEPKKDDKAKADEKDGDEEDESKLPVWLRKKKTGASVEDAPEFTAPTQEKRDKAEGSGHAMPGGRYPVESEEDLRKAIKAVGRAGGPDGTSADRNAVRRHVIAQAKRLGLTNLVPDNWNADGSLKAALVEMHAPVFAALVASAGPLRPPTEWFEDPLLDKPTPLTVQPDGRLFGHAAVWGTPHVGYPGRRVTPPKGADYSRFHHGVVRTKDDKDIAVGTIVLGTDHAPVDREITVAEAMAHYAHSGYGVAIVRAGEDEHGVWISGALCPDVDELRLAALRRCSLSGDWRTIDGKPSFISALAVNVPGFPTPREQTDDEGVTTALVAAGVLMPERDRAARVTVEFPNPKDWAREAFGELTALMTAQAQPPAPSEKDVIQERIAEFQQRMNAHAAARLQQRMARSKVGV